MISVQDVLSIIVSIRAKVNEIKVLRKQVISFGDYLNKMECLLANVQEKVTTDSTNQAISAINDALLYANKIMEICLKHPLKVACLSGKYAKKLESAAKDIDCALQTLHLCNFIIASDIKLTVDEIKWALDDRQNDLKTLLADMLRDEVESLPAKLLTMLREDGFEKPKEAVEDYLIECDDSHLQCNEMSSENSDDIDIANIASSPPSYFQCPITKSLFLDPVKVLESGATYERQAILTYLHKSGADNIDLDQSTSSKLNSCNIDETNFTLLPNRALAQQIKMWQERKRSRTRASTNTQLPVADVSLQSATPTDTSNSISQAAAEAHIKERVSRIKLTEKEIAAKEAAANTNTKYVNKEMLTLLLQQAAYVSFIQQSQADGVMAQSTYSLWKWGSRQSSSAADDCIDTNRNWLHLKLNDIFSIGIISVSKANKDAWHVYMFSEDASLLENDDFGFRFCSLLNTQGSKAGELNVVYVHNPYGGTGFYPIHEIADIVFMRSCQYLSDQAAGLGFAGLHITSSSIDAEVCGSGMTSSFVMKKRVWNDVQQPRPLISTGTASLSPEFLDSVEALRQARVKSMIESFVFEFRVDLADYMSGLPELDKSLLRLSPTQDCILTSVMHFLVTLDCEVTVTLFSVAFYHEYIRKQILPTLGFSFVLGYLEQYTMRTHSSSNPASTKPLPPLNESLDCNIMKSEFMSSCSYLACATNKAQLQTFFLPTCAASVIDTYYQHLDQFEIARKIFSLALSVEEFKPSDVLMTALEGSYSEVAGTAMQLDMQKKYASAALYMAASRVQAQKKDDKKFDVNLKHILIGDSGVGKTCLLLRFVNDSFEPAFITTIGIDFKIKNADIFGVRVKNQIWDTPGQERFRTITKSHIRGAIRGAMMCYVIYDVTDRRSFDSVRHCWMSLIQMHAAQGAPVVLIGNKCDVPWGQREVFFDDGLKLAKEFGLLFFETSAKSDKNVTMAFQLSFAWLLFRLEYLLNDPDRLEAWTATSMPSDIEKLMQASKLISARKRFCALL